MKCCHAILYGPLLWSLRLVERRVVKGERKCHRQAGSKSDSKLVDSDKLSLGLSAFAVNPIACGFGDLCSSKNACA